EHRAQVVLLEALLPLLLQPLEEVLQPRHAAALRIAGAALEEPAKGVHEVALREKIVEHGRQELVGVEVGDGLGAVPARISAQSGHEEMTYATTHDLISEPPPRRYAVHPRPHRLGRLSSTCPACGRGAFRGRGGPPPTPPLPPLGDGRG